MQVNTIDFLSLSLSLSLSHTHTHTHSHTLFITTTFITTIFITTTTTIFIITINSIHILHHKPFRYALTPNLSWIRKRLVDIHHEVLAPKLSWLYADIRSITVILVLGSLAYLIYGLTVEGAIEWIETGAPRMDKAVTLLFGSAETLMGVLRGMWYFSVAAHLAESSYVSYHAIKTLRIRPTQVVLWSIYVLLAGISVTKRFLPLLEAQVASQKKNK